MAAGLLGRLRDACGRRAPLCFACVTALSACGPGGTASESALFGSDTAGLAPADAAEIERIVSGMFPPGPDGTGFLDPNCGDVDPVADVTDLNGDGAGEVFLQWGNACTSGMTGRSLSLFLRDDNGDFRDQFGFPAYGYRLIETNDGDYPDIGLGGPGFCMPVWSWRGQAYEFKCNLPQEDGGCAAERNVCADR